MSSQEFTIAICRQLRLPLYDAVSVCPSCKNTLLDTFGDHSIVCSASGDRIWRHNAVRDQVFHTCKAAHLSPQIESRVNFTSQHRPADVLLPNWSCGRPLAIDVTITSPLQSSIVANAATTKGFAARNAEERKMSASEPSCFDAGVDFQPLAFETSSGVSVSSLPFLKTLLKRCSDVSFCPRSVTFKQFFQRTSVTINKINAGMIVLRLPTNSSKDLRRCSPDEAVSSFTAQITQPSHATSSVVVLENEVSSLNMTMPSVSAVAPPLPNAPCTMSSWITR